MTRAALTLLSLLIPAAALAESPRNVNLEFKVATWYVPAVDSEFGAGVTPYHDVFGGGSFLLWQSRADYLIYSGVFGTAAAGGGIGYGQKSGHGYLSDGETKSSDSTTLHLLPLEFGVMYGYDWLAHTYSIPVVPYGRFDIVYAFWWFTNGVGDTSSYTTPDGATSSSGYGGTWGYRVAGGARLLLDIFAPAMARTFDVDFGVNNSYLLVEYVYASIDDFGSSSSIRLGSGAKGYVNFGLAFEF